MLIKESENLVLTTNCSLQLTWSALLALNRRASMRHSVSMQICLFFRASRGSTFLTIPYSQNVFWTSRICFNILLNKKPIRLQDTSQKCLGPLMHLPLDAPNKIELYAHALVYVYTISQSKQ